MSEPELAISEELKFTPKRVGISLVILFYIYASFLMAWPQILGHRDVLPDPVFPELNYLGIWHRLRLFSPTPPHYTGHLLFEVEYKNGTTMLWHYPRTELCIGDQPHSFDRYVYNYFLLGLERSGDFTYPQFARYILNQVPIDKGQPKSVRFVESFSKIPPPAEGIGKPIPNPDRRIVVYSYDVASGKGTFAPQVYLW